MVDPKIFVELLKLEIERIFQEELVQTTGTDVSATSKDETFSSILISLVLEIHHKQVLADNIYITEFNTINSVWNRNQCFELAGKLLKTRDALIAKLLYEGTRQRRNEMDKALKTITIPFLRQLGFKGSFPHFRRLLNNQVNVLSFQFSQWSSQFCVEIANGPEDGLIINNSTILPNKYTASFLGKSHRLGSEKNNRNYWYDFETKETISDIYVIRANEVIENWQEAENWWNANSVHKK